MPWKVGVGPGSICTTRVVAGVGVPATFSHHACCTWNQRAVESLSLVTGIRFTGDIVKAIAAGAGTIMAGGLFAGVERSTRWNHSLWSGNLIPWHGITRRYVFRLQRPILPGCWRWYQNWGARRYWRTGTVQRHAFWSDDAKHGWIESWVWAIAVLPL